MINKKLAKEMVEFLEEFDANIQKAQGVCGYFESEFKIYLSSLCVFSKFSEFSGCESFPVVIDINFSPSDQYINFSPSDQYIRFSDGTMSKRNEKKYAETRNLFAKEMAQQIREKYL